MAAALCPVCSCKLCWKCTCDHRLMLHASVYCAVSVDISIAVAHIHFAIGARLRRLIPKNATATPICYKPAPDDPKYPLVGCCNPALSARKRLGWVNMPPDYCSGRRCAVLVSCSCQQAMLVHWH